MEQDQIVWDAGLAEPLGSGGSLVKTHCYQGTHVKVQRKRGQRPVSDSARSDGARAGIGETIEPAGVGALRRWPCVTAAGGQMMRPGAADTREAAASSPS